MVLPFILKVHNALNFLNSILGKKARVEIDDYIVQDNDSNLRRQSFTKAIHPEDSEKFLEYNPYEILKSNTDNLTAKFLLLDAIYFQAQNDERIESKIVNYWRYIESFFEAEDFDSKSIKELVSEILSKNVIPYLTQIYFNLASQILVTANYKTTPNDNGINSFLNITNKELWNLLYPESTFDINFKRLLEVIKHPYISKQLKWFLETSIENKVKISYDFYYKILTETYEQRNLVEHAGIHNIKSVEKALLTLPGIASEFRSLIMMKLKEGKHKSFKELIEKIKSKLNN